MLMRCALQQLKTQQLNEKSNAALRYFMPSCQSHIMHWETFESSCHHATFATSPTHLSRHTGSQARSRRAGAESLASLSTQATRLLELLPIRPLIRLTVHLDRLVPRPHVVDKLLVLSLARVELRELVALPIRRNFKRRVCVLTTDNESTTHDGVIGDTEDGCAAEEVLARGFQACEEAADEVRGHEGHGQLVVVLVVDAVDAVFVELAVLPEPGQGDFARLFVGVFALPVWYDR